MTSQSTARRWLSTLARHYPSLLVSGVCHNAVAELDALTAERDRLREALEDIAHDAPTDPALWMEYTQGYARATLKETSK